MATLSLTVPDAYVAKIVSAVREQYQEAVAALTDDEAVKHALKAHLRELVQRYEAAPRHDAGSYRRRGRAGRAGSGGGGGHPKHGRTQRLPPATQVETDFQAVS